MKITTTITFAILIASALAVKQRMLRCGTPAPQPTPTPAQPACHHTVHTSVHHEATHTINGAGQSHVHSTTNGQVQQSGSTNVNGGYAPQHVAAGEKFKHQFFSPIEAALQAESEHQQQQNDQSVIYEVTGLMQGQHSKMAGEHDLHPLVTVQGDTAVLSGICHVCTITRGRQHIDCNHGTHCSPQRTSIETYIASVLLHSNLAWTSNTAQHFHVSGNHHWVELTRQAAH